jgi:DNA-binding MarR family transcriptional regulator
MKTQPSSKKTNHAEFDLENFLPYLLNQAAESTSRSFQAIYSQKYGMTRTQWRVLANLGKFGSMTAKDICRISHIEKTKVSRAITALEKVQLLRRDVMPDDRRAEELQLTAKGIAVFEQLGKAALEYDGELTSQLGQAESAILVKALRSLIKLRMT